MCACLFRTIDNQLTVIPKKNPDCLRSAADVCSPKVNFDIHVRSYCPDEERLNQQRECHH